MKQQNSSYVEIDVFAILRKIWRNSLLIIAVSALFSVLAVCYSMFWVVPKYTATTKIYVVNSQLDTSKQLSLQDVQIGNALVNDYKQVIFSVAVLEEVAQKSPISLTAGELSKKISVGSPKETRVLEIRVTDSDATLASVLANTLRDVSATKFKEITRINSVGTLEEASIPIEPSSPNIKKNVMFASILGALLVIIIIIIKELIDDRIKRPEDVEEAMGLVLLGYIPQVKKIGRR